MESIDSKCTELKKKYDNCFNHWYTEKFLKGEKTDDCQDLFKQYRECIDSVLSKDGLLKMVNEARPHIGSTFSENDQDSPKK
ncbi:TP53-regulated inhibitor of apoptosis 1-B [Smittium culicis]|uniref:TP53-regulated inhibitor of apoptosis 1-B n=1 Tax=Smittium culicis TaxID=133412 RepID=A0A1R1YPL0_9FUNG|nr:TP53-regulated inhibitor of apoptosis 1-B [Smittium culicis]